MTSATAKSVFAQLYRLRNNRRDRPGRGLWPAAGAEAVAISSIWAERIRMADCLSRAKESRSSNLVGRTDRFLHPPRPSVLIEGRAEKHPRWCLAPPHDPGARMQLVIDT